MHTANHLHRQCADLVHALRILRAHGLCDTALQKVYRAVVVARLLYAADRQLIEGFLRRGVRAGYRRTDEPTAAELVEDSKSAVPPSPVRQVSHSAPTASRPSH